MKQRQPSRFLWCGLLGLLSIAATANATPVKSVRVTTYPELAEGQVSGVLLSSQGEARSGFSPKRLALPSLGDDSVRAMAAGDGGVVYLGTGGDVPSVLVYAQGKLRKLGQIDGGSFITSILPLDGANNGQVLVATAQDGRLFRLRDGGKAEAVALLDGERVWSLLRDNQRGVTYATTGPGVLWSIADADLAPLPQGQKKPTRARKLFESDTRQFLSLDRSDDGALYIGTADDAVLYRVDVQGDKATARAVQDFAGNEVRAIAHHKDVIFVAVNDMQRGDTALRGTKIVTPPAGSVPGVKAATSGATPPTNPSPVEKKGKGALYRIDPSGRVEQLHAITDGFFNALSVDAEGNLLAAASTPGGRGRLFWVTPERTIFTALEVKEADALTVSIGPAGRLVGTGNSAALYVLPQQPQAEAGAYYLSKAFYAQAPSRWGRLRYQGQGNLRVETRSGNLQKPDGSWSPFAPLEGLVQQPATDERVGRIASPAGRYLQVRVSFAGQAVLRDFTFYYQPINQRPRVTEILIGDDPTGRVARGTRATTARPRSPIIKLKWKTENLDEDDLNYRIYLRAVTAKLPKDAAKDVDSRSGWLRLHSNDPAVSLLRAEYDFNTETVADGLYELKVVVSDERSNPPEQVLSHELVSPPFLIDNRRPEVRDLAWNATTGTLTGRAMDATSPISELSYSIDGGDFYPVGPRDGVLDDLQEDFAVSPHKALLSPGVHTFLVRAVDAADNAVTSQILVAGPARP